MAKYDMQESTLPHKDGKPVRYPRLVLYGQINSEDMATDISRGTTFGPGEVNGLFQTFVEKMSDYLAAGYSVKIKGLGTFTASLALKQGKEREEADADAVRRNAQSIQVGGINFAPEKSFVQATNRRCTLERASKSFRRSSTKYTPLQRLELAQKFLEKNPLLTVGDYEYLTGLCHSTATKELRKWASLPDSGIDVTGFGSHRVYIRRAAPAEES